MCNLYAIYYFFQKFFFLMKIKPYVDVHNKKKVPLNLRYVSRKDTFFFDTLHSPCNKQKLDFSYSIDLL